MSVTTAASAEEALGVLAAAPGGGVEVALLDQRMPDGDGADLARTMTQDERFRGVHRILLTSTGHRDAWRSGEVEHQLTKPVRESALLDGIAAVLGRRTEAVLRPAGPAGGARPAAGTRGRILLAEDNPVNQFVGEHLLISLGYQVDVVGDGAAALKALRGGDYVAVLMDCQMPVLDGYQAATAIRRAEGAGRRIPIIAMTASAMEGDAERSLAAGMDDHLAKPVRAEELERVLASRLAPL
jgi:hypothetical protein